MNFEVQWILIVDTTDFYDDSFLHIDLDQHTRIVCLQGGCWLCVPKMVHQFRGHPQFHMFSFCGLLYEYVIYVLCRQCSFLSKALIAENAGAIAIVITDNDPSNDDKLIEMLSDGTPRATRIPAFFLLGKDGSVFPF